MKNRALAFVVSVALLIVARQPVVDSAFAAENPAGIEKVTEQQARTIAHKRYPDSAFESAELETEHGHRIWSIDLRPHGSNDIREVQIDAISGEIIATELETPDDQAREAAEDKAANEH